ncbi:hypothetical protein MBRU_12490 [Mycolicibacterium brumae DSM 44177]|nr:hypothetical protein MBRU_12490 [Mycolicibacterium brumae DSM 44177]
MRGPRFAAWITTAVLIATILVAGVDPRIAAVLLAAQAVVFAIGAAFGPTKTPYGRFFATVVKPQLGPAIETEPVAPLRFAQLIGLVFAVVGVAGFALGAPAVGLVATGFALFAAFLNAAFDVCLGCLLYPLAVRLRAQGVRS